MAHIVRVSHILQSSVIGVVWVYRGQLLRVFTHFQCLLVFPLSPEPCGFVQERVVSWIGLTACSSAVCWYECFFNVLVQLVQVDITQNWTDYPALGCAAQCGVIFPIFEISCLKEFTNETKKSPVVYLFCQCIEQDLMIQAVKRSINSIPCSRTRITQVQPKSRSLTLAIRFSDAAFR